MSAPAVSSGAATATAPALEALPGTVARSVPEAEPARRRGAAQAALLAALRAYQALRSGHPSPCRFYPTCSTYATEAVSEHGAWRGAWLAARRVARCRPFGGHGIDLVPPAGPGRGAQR